MEPKADTQKGWAEVIIDDDCGFDKFYACAAILRNSLERIFTNKIDDFDTIFWEFEYKGSILVLYYNIYNGVTLFPKGFKEATKTDNENVIEIGNLLFHKLIDADWYPFDNGKSAGTKGSESGTIITDIENTNGARITLEKECGDIPFAVTLGIYGLMFHTRFEGNATAATEYIIHSKCRINKIFDLYKTAEEARNEFWHKKHDRLVAELAEM